MIAIVGSRRVRSRSVRRQDGAPRARPPGTAIRLTAIDSGLVDDASNLIAQPRDDFADRCRAVAQVVSVFVKRTASRPDPYHLNVSRMHVRSRPSILAC